MKKFLIIPLMLLTIALSACGSNNEEVGTPGTPSVPSDSDNSDNSNDNSDNQTTLTMKIIRGNRTIMATMEANAAAKDLLSRLPLEITCRSHSNDLIKIGHIDGNGIEALQLAGAIKVKLEK